MKLPRYELKVEKALMVFEFISEGKKGSIPKLIKFSETTLHAFYNLAFGDKDSTTLEINDIVVVNNGDCRTALSPVVIPAISSTTTGRYLGYKEFELTNHLGNVIATVSDRKIQLRECAVIYEDFGDAIMNGVTATNAIIEIENNRLKVQPTQLNGGVNISYSTTPGIPYRMSFEIDLGTSALENGRLVDVFSYNSTTGDTTILSTTPINQNGVYTLTFTGQPLSNGGTKLFFRTNVNVANQQYFYLDNFKVVVATSLEGGDPIGLDPCSDGLSTFSGYFPDLLMHTDYYAFGMEMPGRKWAASNYRYGMNGQESEPEIVGSAGSIYSAEYWMYDARLGRRWNRDPVRKHWESPYASFLNSPILVADPKGLDGEKRARKQAEKTGGDVRNIGEGKWEVVSVKEGKSSEFSSTGKEMEVNIETFKDNIFERMGKGIVSGLKSADRWVNSHKGNWKEGREWEGLDGPFHSAESGVKVEGRYGLVQVTADSHITEGTSSKLDKSAEINVNMLSSNPANMETTDPEFSASAYMKFNVNRPDNSGIEINQKVSFRNIYIQLNWQLSGFQGFEFGVTTDKVSLEENRVGEGSMNVIKITPDGVTYPVFNQNNK